MAGSPSRGLQSLDINSPDAQAPRAEEFKFDPNGPGHFGAAMRDPLGFPYQVFAALGAWKKTAEKYPGVLSRDNEADAYKHAMWNYLMAQTVGKDRAKAFADAHEVSVPNATAEQLMDLYNNEKARNLPRGPNAVEDALRSGEFRTSPFRVPGDDGQPKKTSVPGFPPITRRW
jgi:hypothetical protein